MSALLPKHKDKRDGEGCYREADGGEHPVAAAAGLGQVEAPGVHHGQRHKGVERALVRLHAHGIAVHGRVRRQELVHEILLLTGIPRIVLHHAERVGIVHRAFVGLGGADHDVDVVLQQRVALVRLHLGERVAVVLQALDLHLAAGGRDEVRRLRFLRHMADHIVYAVHQLGGHEVIVARVLENKLDPCEIAAVIGEELRKIDTIAEHMAVVQKQVNVIAVAALPGEHNAVAIAVIAAESAV